MDAHRPYNPPDEYISKFTDKEIPLKEKVIIKKMVRIVRKKPEIVKRIDDYEKKLTEILYNAELNYIDHFFGIFLNYLKKINILNEINFIITSDHGESLFEHKKLGHQASLYDELLKIPLIIRPSNSSILFKKKIKEQVQLIDIAPTILDLFNLPKENSFEGSSLVPLLNENDQYKHPEYAICATLHNSYRTMTIYEKHLFTFYLLIACRTNNWKIIFDEEINEFFLYNLKKDPLELTNLINNNSTELLYVKRMLLNKIAPYIKEYSSESTKIRRNIDKNILKLKNKI
jgi:arylsulfatase A-like enzyme